MIAPALVDRTTFATQAVRLGIEAGPVTVVAKGTFDLVPGGGAKRTETQAPLLGDVPVGQLPRRSTRYESDFAPFKPRADLLCVGSAHPPDGKHTNCVVSFGVGSFQKRILVVGDRTWKLGIGRLNNTPTSAAPFTSMPISYDRAFGGRDPADKTGLGAYPQNPIGRGYTTNSRALEGLALPNLEDPANPIRSWKDQPAPMGFGPVGRTWQPRFKRVGTYDKRWLEPGAPAVPEDFDERYYNCAPDDQQVECYLRGDEKIRVTNMHPQHRDLQCRLPKLRVRCFVDRRGAQGRRLDEVPMNLDTLWVDMDTLTLALVWRGRFDPTAPKEAVVSHVLVVSEPLDARAREAENYRPEIDAFEAAEEEPTIDLEDAEPAETPSGG